MDHRLKFSVEKMCHVLGVSRSNYYRWYKQLRTAKGSDVGLDGLIDNAFEASRPT